MGKSNFYFVSLYSDVFHVVHISVFIPICPTVLGVVMFYFWFPIFIGLQVSFSIFHLYLSLVELTFHANERLDQPKMK